MSAAAKSVLVFGIYMLVQGATLLVVPNLLLSLSGLPETNEVWARLVGWCLCALGFYYVQAARQELIPFFRWTVIVRVGYFVVTLALCLTTGAPWMLLGFAAVETCFGIWTGLLLRSVNRES